MQAFKRKGVILYGTKISGKSNNDSTVWLNQGPFGRKTTVASTGVTGFSINGARRNIGYVGKGMSMSQNGTPFKGVHPMGTGGSQYNYVSQPILNANIVYVMGNQYHYVKPSVLSQRGMLEKKYRWVKTGQYPANWVQPDDNLPENFSQGVYISEKAAANLCVNDVNDSAKYINDRPHCQRHISKPTIASGGCGITKFLHIPRPSSQHTEQIQKKCSNPKGDQKPFPFACNNGPNSASNSTPHACGAPPIETIYYNSPPRWYTHP